MYSLSYGTPFRIINLIGTWIGMGDLTGDPKALKELQQFALALSKSNDTQQVKHAKSLLNDMANVSSQ